MNYRTITLAISLTLAAVLQIPSSAAETNQVHTARGIVREIAPDYHKAVIRHEAIPNYMPAMTMEFNVRDTNELSGVGVGDTVTFQLTATDETHWIDHVRKIASATNAPTPLTPRITPARIAELKPGDPLPDYELMAETARTSASPTFAEKQLRSPSSSRAARSRIIARAWATTLPKRVKSF